MLDEVSQSYSHQRNLKFDQTRYTTEKQNHEFVDLGMIKLLSRVYALYEEQGYAIMDYPFVPFHIRADIAKHVGLQNVARTLMDQPQEQESRILIVRNIFRGMELRS
jgi:hypothetical protein